MSDKIPGIYNICDRWCERCFYQDKCLLFEREEETEKLLKEKGIDDPEEKLTEQLSSTFNEVSNMLQDFLDKEGIDLNELIDEMADLVNEEPDESAFEEVKNEAENLMGMAFKARKEINDVLQKEDQDFIRNIRLKNKAEAEKLSLDVTAAINIMNWHSTFINSKVHRMAMEMSDPEFDEVTMTFEGKEYSAKLLTAKLLYVCLVEMQEALLTIYNATTLATDYMSDMVLSVEKIIIQVKHFSPGIEDYKRPYFDY